MKFTTRNQKRLLEGITIWRQYCTHRIVCYKHWYRMENLWLLVLHWNFICRL